MDEIEQKILEELSEDARKPFSHIAKKIGISTQTVINRYNEMKSKGIIKICSITVNLEKMGYVGTAHLLLKISPSTIPLTTINELNKFPDAIIASTTLGDYEGYGVIAFRDINDLFKKIRSIKHFSGITNIELLIAVPGMMQFPPSRKFKKPQPDSK